MVDEIIGLLNQGNIWEARVELRNILLDYLENESVPRFVELTATARTLDLIGLFQEAEMDQAFYQAENKEAERRNDGRVD
jgi:hypothetical protein